VRSLVTQSARVALRSTTTNMSVKISAGGTLLVRSYYTVASQQVQVATKKSTVLRRTINSIDSNSINYIPPAFSKPNEASFSSKSYPREITFLGGAPGSGKGTNSSHISYVRNYSAPTIVVSDLLNTPTCKLLKDNGVMINDEFVFQTLLAELQKPIYRDGVVVDGFPRTEVQVDYLNKLHQYQAASSLFLTPKPRLLFVMLHVDEAASIARQQARGTSHVLMNSAHAAQGNKDLLVEVRATDLCVNSAKARYEVFKEQYEAVMSLGNKFPLVVVDASVDPETVKVNIAKQMAHLPSVMCNF